MTSRQDLILNWLKNIVWDSLTVWEQEFVDSLWVKDKEFSTSQSIKLSEIYEKFRRPKQYYASLFGSKIEYAYTF